MINMNGRQNEYWTASPLRPKSGSNIAKLLLHMRVLLIFLTNFSLWYLQCWQELGNSYGLRNVYHTQKNAGLNTTQSGLEIATILVAYAPEM